MEGTVKVEIYCWRYEDVTGVRVRWDMSVWQRVFLSARVTCWRYAYTVSMYIFTCNNAYVKLRKQYIYIYIIYVIREHASIPDLYIRLRIHSGTPVDVRQKEVRRPPLNLSLFLPEEIS